MPIFRGVFAVGHGAIGRIGHAQAAILACGQGTVVSHMSAAELHDLTRRRPVLIDVISANQAGRKIQGVRWHRSPPLVADEIAQREGIPCTTVGRTLVDLAGILGERSMRRLIDEAAVQRSLDIEAIDLILSRRRRRGAPLLRRLLRPWRRANVGERRLRSRLEARLLRGLAERGLALPETNVNLDLGGNRLEIDLLWRKERLAIETDGEETHATMSAFHRDRRRDQLLVAAGYRVSRVTWDQLDDEPGAVFGRIRRALER